MEAIAIRPGGNPRGGCSDFRLIGVQISPQLQGRLTGADLKEKFLQGSESFAMMDEPMTMRFLSPAKAQRMKNLNPKLFEEEACGIDYLKEAPELKKLPPPATPKLY